MIPIHWVPQGTTKKTMPMVRLSDLRAAVCQGCRSRLPYKNGFHSAQSKSREYFKICDADVLIGTEEGR